MLTIEQFKSLFRSNQPVYLAVVGDSTSAGFGANPGPNLWSNGRSYGCMNNPDFGPNWTPSSPFVISIPMTQAQQDNKGIPSAVRLLRTYVESANPASKVYNFGVGGHTAGGHVADGTIAIVAAQVPKPQVVFLNLGINSAKSDLSQDADLRTLVAQCMAADMRPVLVIPNNVGVAGSPAGAWSATATPDNWYPMDNWQATRANIQQIALDNSLPVIDLGTPSGALDITLLYDPFHPSDLGYQAIFNIYKDWLSIQQSVGDGPVRFRNSTDKYYVNPEGALRVRTSTGVVGLTLTLGSQGGPQIKTSLGVATIE